MEHKLMVVINSVNDRWNDNWCGFDEGIAKYADHETIYFMIKNGFKIRDYDDFFKLFVKENGL